MIRFRGRLLSAIKRTGDRVCTPEETLDRVRPLLPRAGITRLADVTGLDRLGLPTVLAFRPNALSMSVSCGKGLTRPAAAAAAAMEAVEGFSAETLRGEEFVAGYERVRAERPCLEPDELPLADGGLFDATRPVPWVMGWDLGSESEIAVPARVADLVPTYQDAFGFTAFRRSGNGLSAGNHLLEAILNGLTEVVERDAVGCTLAAALRGYLPPHVDPDGWPSPPVREVRQRARDLGFELGFFDRTVDTAVPTYEATLTDRGGTGETYHGFGAHLDPAAAMMRAATEAMQIRLTYITGSRDELFRTAHQRDRTQTPTVPRRSGPAPARSSDATDSLDGDVRVLLNKLAAVGIHRVVVCDLTHPRLGIPVVRVFVPGLENGLDERFRPGVRGQQFAREVGR